MSFFFLDYPAAVGDPAYPVIFLLQRELLFNL